MILHLKYKFLEHPYAEEDSSISEKWAEIVLALFDMDNQLIKVIFEHQWNIIVFLDWVKENKDALLTEKLPPILQNVSIAKGIFEFYEKIDPDNDPENLIDTVYSYRQRHGIRFAFRGVDIDDIYIGYLKNAFTISQYDGKESKWSFEIDPDVFFNDVRDTSANICRS